MSKQPPKVGTTPQANSGVGGHVQREIEANDPNQRRAARKDIAMKFTLFVALSILTLTGCAEDAGFQPPKDRDQESAPATPSRTTQVPGTTSQNPGTPLPSTASGGNTAGAAAAR